MSSKLCGRAVHLFVRAPAAAGHGRELLRPRSGASAPAERPTRHGAAVESGAPPQNAATTFLREPVMVIDFEA